MLAKFEAIVKDACHLNNVGLYDIDVKNTQHGKILCVFITKYDGVDISDCVNVTKSINSYLFTDDSFIEGHYTLEVSSPGIERPLKLKKHYTSAINENINVSYYHENTKKTISGLLLEVNQDNISIEAESDTTQIFFNTIQKAKTCYKKSTKEK
jgi:ribosome maturation factor RimP